MLYRHQDTLLLYSYVYKIARTVTNVHVYKRQYLHLNERSQTCKIYIEWINVYQDGLIGLKAR